MTQLVYTDIGQGTPIILIHGLGSRKEAWKAQDPLSTKYRLIAVDLRGHGATAKNTELTVANFASDVIRLLNTLQINSAYICGLSLGGIVAQEIHVQRPDLVAGLILASTTSYIPSIFTHGVIREARRAFNKGSLIDDIVQRGIVNVAYQQEARDAFLIRECYMEAAQSGIGLNYYFSLGTVTKPVLLIGAYQDQVISWWNVRWMKKWVRHAETVILQDCGHLCNIERAEKFNECLDAFINNASREER